MTGISRIIRSFNLMTITISINFMALTIIISIDFMVHKYEGLLGPLSFLYTFRNGCESYLPNHVWTAMCCSRCSFVMRVFVADVCVCDVVSMRPAPEL